jgi:phage gpG-like protein
MADNFDVEVKLPNFGRLTEATRSNMRGAVVTLTRRLAELVRRNLSGTVLNVRSGRLRGSIRSEMIETKDEIGGRVYSEGVPYARIHEFGGQTSPHVIMARNSKSLAFVWGSRGLVFFKSVNHPGSRIPERSYMRSALEEMRSEIIETYRKAGGEGAHKAAAE